MVDAVPEPTFIRTARRTQLVEAAIALIAEDGLGAASTVRIARRAGTSRGVLTYHFRDRADLLDAVVEEVYAVAGSALRRAVQAADGPRAALLVFVGGSVDFYAAHPDHMAALTAIFAERGRDFPRPARDRERDARHARETTDVAALLHAGQAAGEMRDFDVPTMVALLRAVLDSGLHRLRAGTDATALRSELVAAADALTRA